MEDGILPPSLRSSHVVGVTHTDAGRLPVPALHALSSQPMMRTQLISTGVVRATVTLLCLSDLT